MSLQHDVHVQHGTCMIESRKAKSVTGVSGLITSDGEGGA